MAASPCGRILIADSNNQCVQVRGRVTATSAVCRLPSSAPAPFQIFCNDGEFKNRFGVRGRSPGQLQRPTGVAVHPSGDIIIADYDNKWVSIFSCEGKFKVRADQLTAGGWARDPRRAGLCLLSR